MKLKSSLFALLALATFTGSAAFASVDSFRGVKFGSSFEDLEKGHVCHWSDKSFKPSLKSRVYHCSDFRMQGIKQPLKVFVEFTDGKFFHASVDVPKNELGQVEKLLKAKYGAPKKGEFKDWEYYAGGDVMIAPSSTRDIYALVYKGIDKSL